MIEQQTPEQDSQEFAACEKQKLTGTEKAILNFNPHTSKISFALFYAQLISRSVIRYYAYGPDLPSWNLKGQILMDILRVGTHEQYKLTDDDLSTLDIYAYMRIRRQDDSLSFIINDDIKGLVVSENCIEVVNDLTISPLPLFDGLCKYDAKLSESGSPRTVQYEVTSTPDLVKEIEEELGLDHDFDSILEARPLHDQEYIVWHIHGGAYLTGSPRVYRQLKRNLSIVTGLRVFGSGYRLAPESKYPAQLHDAYITYQFLLNQGFDPSRIVIVGDSAGANLALALIHLLRMLKLPTFRGLVFLSPWAKLFADGDSISYNASYDFLKMDKENPLYPARLYLDPGMPLTEELLERSKDKLISPIYGDFTGFPPMLVQYGDCEILKSNIVEFVERVRLCQKVSANKAIVTRNSRYSRLTSNYEPLVTCEGYKDMPHMFQMVDHIDPAKEAIAKIGQFVKNLTNQDFYDASDASDASDSRSI
ncbi:hypothetical protein H4219_000991 [Mycoemilia scoparia]|uniref:Alpha/beta hydrolase fold-3 domain-containing protein n=1 Tax=Mycoemilia scoparia TaxID=417184 RepID=A0A9W8A738_9FUNG|nr:hypothetical protein H4219_000991 [Mycoemilia scoparia]